jgi:hypothetical protein
LVLHTSGGNCHCSVRNSKRGLSFIIALCYEGGLNEVSVDRSST